MTWRKCLVRGLVFSVLGGIVAAAIVYQAWTNPAATRRQVLGQLDKTFLGAHVTLESARLRILGGISFTDLRMTRRDALDRADFLYVPDGIIYHDKERLANGDLAIRKIELHRLRLRIVRDHDGNWNVADLLGPVDLKTRVPMLVFQQATVLFEDQTTTSSAPLLELKDVNLTVVNDPLPSLVFDGSGVSDVAGPVRFSGKVQRANGECSFDIDAPAIPVGPALVDRLAALAPDAAVHIRTLRGEGHVKAAVAYRPGTAQPLTYDATATLKKAEFSHPQLAWALQDGEVMVHVVNGSIPLVHVVAHSGPSNFDLTLKDVPLSLPPGYSITDDGSVLTELVREMDLRCEHVYVTDELFKCLPDTVQSFKKEYAPCGYLSMTHTFRKDETGRWRKRFLLTAEDMQATYWLFRYTVDHIKGTIDVEYDNDIQPLVKLDLVGRSRDRPVALKGSAQAAKNKSFIDMDIMAEKIPLDKKLLDALPETTQHIVKEFLPDKNPRKGAEFRPMGCGDVKVELRRRRGSPDLNKSFFVTFHDASLCYDLFPYPLENVSGFLAVLPDHWEVSDFHGTHHGGEIAFSGHSEPLSGRASVIEQPERVCVELSGRNIKLDDADFTAALTPLPSLQHTWSTLRLAGAMNFEAKVVDVPGQPKDIDVGVTINGCKMRPTFFDYALDDVSGTFAYTKGRVKLKDVTAKHGSSVLRLTAGQVIPKGESGGYQVRFDAIQGTPVVLDDDFLNALPFSIQEGLRAIKLHGPVWAGTALIVDASGEADPNPLVWWDGGAYLRDASIQTGLEVSHINGLVTCCGLHKDRDMQLVGHLAVEQATLLNQPVQDVQARFFIQPKEPNALCIHDLTADLFGGPLGGEGRVEFGPKLEYDLTLKALNLRLEQFGRHNFGNDADIQGPLCAALHLWGEGRDIGGLKGNGHIFVRDARLYKLPALLDLLKAFNLRLPDRTAFDQASVSFAIDGPQMRVEQFDLVGNAISLRGQGTVGLNGDNINLDFNADWARLGQVFPEVMTEIPRKISDELLQVKVRGSIRDVHFDPVFLPPVFNLFSN
jgi:hypothetical protein